MRDHCIYTTILRTEIVRDHCIYTTILRTEIVRDHCIYTTILRTEIVRDHYIYTTIIDRSSTPWYTNRCKELKSEKRRAERNYMKNKSAINLDVFKQAVIKYKEICYMEKSNFYLNKIRDCNKNQKDLFKIVNSLLHRKKDKRLPSFTDAFSLANSFSFFFKTKIDKIRETFSSDTPYFR